MKKLVFWKKRDAYILFLFSLLIIILVALVTNPVFLVKKKGEYFIKTDDNLLRNHVEFLSNINPNRSYFNHRALNEAAEYIKIIFSENCETVEEQVFNKDYKNIICSFNADKEERIIIGAHYDTFGITPGADDNASGVAGLLELSRLLSKNEIKTENRIDIVAYSLEEPPFFRSENMGSFVHAKKLRDNNEEVKLAIILEMIGYYSDSPKSQDVPMAILKPLYPSKGNFISIVSKIGQGREARLVKRKMKEVMNMDVYSFSGPSFIQGVDFSDHLSYWKNDYSAIMISDTSFYRNKNYHTKKDTPATLNYGKMSDVINGVYWSISYL